jgi:cytoskeletal protein RodZ
MSTILKIIITIIVIILVLLGIWLLYFFPKQTSTVSTTKTQQVKIVPTTQINANTGLATSPSDISNTALNSDLSSADSQMNSVNTDLISVDQSLNQ